MIRAPRPDRTTIAVRESGPRLPAAPKAAQDSEPRQHVPVVSEVAPTGALARMVYAFHCHRRPVQAVVLGVSLLPTMGASLANTTQPAERERDRTEAESLARETLFDSSRLPRELATDSGVLALAPSVRSVLAESLSRHEPEASARPIVANLVRAGGFSQLSEAQQVRLIRLVGGTNAVLSESARWRMGALLQSELGELSIQDQAAKLRAFLTEQPARPSTVTLRREAVDRAPFALVGPEAIPAHPFRSGTGAADKYSVVIEGRSITVWMTRAENVPGKHRHTIDQIAKGLAGMPAAMRNLVQEISVEPSENPEDEFWRTTYSDPELKAYMTAVTGRIAMYPTSDPQSQKTLDGTFVHEVGHMLSDSQWGPLTDVRWGAWKAAMEKDGLFASTYATKSPGEDFSETLQLYYDVKGTAAETELRGLFGERFVLIDALLANPP